MANFRDRFEEMVDGARAEALAKAKNAERARLPIAPQPPKPLGEVDELIILKNHVVRKLNKRQIPVDRILQYSGLSGRRGDQEVARGWKVAETQVSVGASYDDKGRVSSPNCTTVNGYLLGNDATIRRYSGGLASPDDERGIVNLDHSCNPAPAAERDSALLGRFAEGLAQLVFDYEIKLPKR